MKKSIKKLVATVLLSGVMLAMTACGKTDAVQDDLYTYLNNMTEAQVLQQEAITEYNTYVTSADADSQQLLTALNDSIIPKYQNYMAKLDAVTPETEEVQTVKAACEAGANKQLDALNKVVEAINACDTDLLNEADTLIRESEQAFADYESQLQTLASEHNIELVNDGAGAGNDNSDASATDSEAGTEEAATEAE